MDAPTAEGASAVTREELHFRRIDMRGFRRSDGLFEVEGRVTDRKPHDFVSPNGTKRVPAHQPIHDMGVRLVFDEGMVIHQVHTFTESAPYADCHEGGRGLKALHGLRIGGGWSREVRSRLGGPRSCTHLMEILIPMASAAYQTLTELRRGRPDPLDANGKPVKVDSCHAYAAHREVVLRRWPAWYRPEPPPASQGDQA
ncbi:MAG TPA: DUF2889 domain-containing protein [Ramlibacter sp.]|nr:DUF2889 domain-containing protein [Ramlibacter sp.]